MAYERQYETGVNWQNLPSQSTPINASNLNQMDQAIINVDAEVDQALTEIESDMADMQQDIAGKQDTLVFDDHPILGSSKPVTSDGIFRAIQQGGGGGGGDVTLDSVYLIGSDNMPSSVSPNLTINTVNRVFEKDTKQYIMFRFGAMAEAGSWPSNYDITLNVNSTGDFIVKKNHVKQTTDNWTIKKDVVYMACINYTAGAGSTSYFWDLFEIPYDASGTYDILPTAHGGTGNALGYIRTGQKANTTAGTAATAEGSDNTIHGNYSHAEGQLNTATGNYSHAGGYYNTAGYQYQTVIGRFNDNQMTTLFEVGNGQSDFYRSNAFEVYTTGDVKVSGSLYVGTSIYDHNNEFVVAVSANPSGDATTPLSKIKIDGTVFSVGGGTSMSKTRYTVTYSSWSSSQSSGYYTYTLTLSPQLDTTYPPNIYIASNGDSAFPSDGQLAMYSLLDRCNITASNTLVLYAKTKPTSTFYIYVEGVRA